MLITRLIFCLVLVTTAVANEISSSTGQLVVIKDDYPIKIGNQVVPTHGFVLYSVKHVQGDWLWIVSGGVEGWVPASRVVLFDQAIEFYTQEIMTNPGNSAAWNHRGAIWREQNQYDRAIDDFDEAIRLDPSSAAYTNRGMAWSGKKQHDKAIADYTAAIRLNPNDADAFHHRGNVWWAKKEYDKAITDYTEASG